MATASEIKADIAAKLPTNTEGAITAGNLVICFNNILDNLLIPNSSELQAIADQATAASLEAQGAVNSTRPQAVKLGTFYELNLATDAGREISLYNAGSITLSLPVPSAGDVGKIFPYIQLGLGRVQASPAIGTQLVNSQLFTKTFGQYALAAVRIAYLDNVGTIGYILTGDLAA